MSEPKPNVPKLRFPGFTDPWEQRKLGDEFVFLRNNTLSRADLSEINGSTFNVHYGDVLIRFESVLDLSEQSVPHIADDRLAAKLSCDTLHEGDVIIADTAEDETAGKCTELQGLGNSVVYSGLHTIPLRPKREYAPGFLGHYLNSPAFRAQLGPLMQGVKVISISRSSMAGTTLRSPSFSEQRAIGSLFRDIDGLIALRQRELDHKRLFESPWNK